MKFSVILCMLLFPVPVLAASDLPLRLAHQKGFTGCDAAITEAFELTKGEVRVNISQFPETMADSVKLTTTFGEPGNSTFIESEFRKVGTKCYWTHTSIFTLEKNCMEVKEMMSDFKYVAQSADFTWTGNKGVNLILKSVGSGCVGILQVDKVR